MGHVIRRVIGRWCDPSVIFVIASLPTAPPSSPAYRPLAARGQGGRGSRPITPPPTAGLPAFYNRHRQLDKLKS
jgi:hypothetical protein